MPSRQTDPDVLTQLFARQAGRPDLWPDAFDQLGAALGGVGALLEVYDGEGMLGVVGPRAPFFDDAIIQSYITDFQPLSPRPVPLAGAVLNDVQFDAQLGDDRTLDRNPFYAEFLPKQGLRYFVSTVLPLGQGTRGVVSVQRTPKAGHVGAAEIALLRHLRPALQAMIEPALGALFQAAHTDATAAVLPHLAPFGAVLSMNGNVLELGERVQELVPLEPRKGPRSGVRFHDATLAALQDAGQRSRTSGGCVSELLEGKDGKAPVQACVRAFAAPWGAALRMRTGVPANMMVLAVSFQPVRPDPRADLKNHYGLTLRERDVLMALADGQSPQEIAEDFGMSVVTVRSHLARLREKTDCQSAAQLVALVLRQYRERGESATTH